MRTLFASVSIVLALLYATGAVYLYRQERWARSPAEAGQRPVSDLYHPEATLLVVRQSLNTPTSPDDQLARLHRVLGQVPSFYQPPLLLAHHHASRVENPRVVHQSFSLAIGRFRANGRLHLAYGEWLLKARSDLAAWSAINESQEAPIDPLDLAEEHLRTAVELEPALTDRVLTVAQRRHVSPTRWHQLVPNDDHGLNTLLSFLFSSGYDEEAFRLLEAMLITSEDVSFLRKATHSALQRGEGAIALEAALKWRDAETRSSEDNSFQWAIALSRAHLQLGDTDAAFHSFRSALKQIEESSSPSSRASLELLCSMGNEYLSRSDIVLAESLFAEASALAPSYTPATIGLARISRRTGDNEQAIALYQKVLRLDPNNAEAERELSRLVTTTIWKP